MSDHGRNHRQLYVLFLNKTEVFHGPFREFCGDIDIREVLVNTLCNRCSDIVKEAADSGCTHGELFNRQCGPRTNESDRENEKAKTDE